MYCKNCGKELEEANSVCISCGALPNDGDKYCENCGKKVEYTDRICAVCGRPTRTKTSKKTPSLNGRDKKKTMLLCLFLGGLGVHNFYMGEMNKGLLKIVTTVFLGVGLILALIDLIKIIKDKYVYDQEAKF